MLKDGLLVILWEDSGEGEGLRGGEGYKNVRQTGENWSGSPI